jgi:uncharacterized protein (DUF488 family)
LTILYTIGYGGRALDDFLEIIKTYSIKAVIDVRRWNSSRKLPEYSGKNLEYALRQLDIEYHWFPLLGGYRKFGVDVEDIGVARCFESEGFRAYATYVTLKEDVKSNLVSVESIARSKTATLLCSERMPWRCHRKILADYFLARGFTVLHILESKKVVEHQLSKCAEIVENRLVYK